MRNTTNIQSEKLKNPLGQTILGVWMMIK